MHAANHPSGEDNLRYVLACHLRDLGFSKDEARTRLHVWNEHEAHHPRAPAAVDKAVTNAYAYARDVPGNAAAQPAEDAFAARISPAEEPAEEPGDDIGRMVHALRRHGFRARGWSLDAAVALEAPDWFVEGVILREGFGLLYGPPKGGKSYAALDLALSTAFGRPWLGAWHVRSQGRVLYMALEGADETMARAGAWCRHHGITPDERVAFVSGLRFNVDEINVALSEAMGDPGTFALCIIDTTARAMTGLDENLARDQAIVADRFERLAEDAKCPVVALHHSGKDVTRGARGSNALLAAASSSILVTMSEEGSLVLEVEDIRRGMNGRRLTARAVLPGDYTVWQAAPPMDHNGGPVPVRSAALEALVSAMCSGVDAEIVTRSALLQRVEAHAPKNMRGRDLRLDAERLLDTLGVMRAQIGDDGRVALMRPADRQNLMERLRSEAV